MATKSNTAEGQAAGTGLLASNSGTSGSAFSSVNLNGAACTYDNATAAFGSQSYKLVPLASTSSTIVWSGVTSTAFAYRTYVRWATLPSSTAQITSVFNTSAALVGRIVVTTGGVVGVRNAADSTVYTSTGTLATGTWYCIEHYVVPGTTTSNGTIQMRVLDLSGAAVSGMSYTATGTANAGTVNVGSLQLGKIDNGAWVSQLNLDSLKYDDAATGFVGPDVAPPTAAFTSSAVALAASFDATGSTAAGGATITGYSWDFGDTTSGTGATPAHTYSGGGTYTVVLTVTDSNSQTGTVSHSLTVAAASGTASVQSVTASTGWTPSSGTVLSAITDGDPTTFDTSSAGPTGQEFDCVLQALVPPAAGQPLKVFLQMDALSATSATLNAQLYEGATSRATLTGIAIPSGSGGSVTGLVTLTFPWSSVSAITTGGWNALTLKLQITAA